jgi:hypothetical protein
VGNGIQYHANYCQCSLNMSVCISIGKEFSGTTMVFCIGVSFPIPPTGCCYSFLDLWSNTIIGSSCNSVCDVCNHSLNGLCIVKDLRSCQDSSTKCNFCNHIVISYGVQKQADPTEGPIAS